jgi:molybdopterin converting factor small subunit
VTNDVSGSAWGQKKVDARPHWVTVAADESMTPRAATITVHIPGPLRDCCAGAAELALSVTSVRAVLAELEQRHPALHRSICDETGAVRRHINLFVNAHHMRDRNGLDTALAPGDEVCILPAVSGG